MLGCIQPMSSPMMKRMLGLPAGACAIAGKLNAASATPETSMLPIRLLIFMIPNPPFANCDRRLGSTFDLPVRSTGNRSSLFASGYREAIRFVIDPSILRRLLSPRYAIPADSYFLIDFLRSVDEGVSPKMVR